MIYPSGRAAILAAASALPAIAVAVLVPAYWYAGLIIVLLVLALTAADALATPGAKALQAVLEAPRAAYVGQDVKLDIMARVGGGRRFEAAVEHDARLVPAASGSELSNDSRTMRLAAVRRGSATIDALWLRWPGILGLVWRQKRIDLERKIAVLPDVRPVRAEALRLFRRDASIGEIVQVDTGAGGEFQALAEFRQGMDRRAIDWKASARHGGLIAKEYRTERNNEIVFLRYFIGCRAINHKSRQPNCQVIRDSICCKITTDKGVFPCWQPEFDMGQILCNFDYLFQMPNPLQIA
jgi:uncharacterized protein (DUF58 family)